MGYDNAVKDDRQVNKARARQKKWLERQERSKFSREDIDILQHQRTDLRRELDEKQESADQANTVATDGQALRLFSQLPISQRTQMGLERGNYKKLTPIQSESLHLALAGYDVLGAAKTGSGKTLCFVIPVLERLFVERWDAEMGVGAIILSPTRELALQIFKVMQMVGYKHVLSAALLTGGRDVQEERKRLHAISIFVGTPGRILHHLQDDSELVLDNLQILCMDEADRLLDLGFRESITEILRYLPPQRQTLLFSATQTTDVQMLAQMSLRQPRYASSHDISASPAPSTLSQNFVVLELHRKLDALLMFLKRHPSDKIVVFVSTCNQVKYMYLAFSKILKKMRIPSMCLTSKMKQFRREEVFMTFCRCKSAVLFCTDIAARGLDFPLVHWVIQYDCPDSAQTYIHRAGRTARAGARGANLLFLTPRETPMLSYLANKHLVLREIAVKTSLMHVSQEIFVALVVQGLKYEAQKAFIAYLRSMYFASNKHVFDVKSVDVEKFAHSLGLMVVPDMSELNNLQRGAKNLPWDVVNYIAKQRTNASDAHITRKERHLQASDMFRVMEQKQKFAPKADDDDDNDDSFFVKTEKKVMDETLHLTADERLAGLSKQKKRKFLETPDLRIRDLGFNSRVVYSDDEDEDEEKFVKRRQSNKSGDDDNADEPALVHAVVHRSADQDESDGEDNEEDFSARLQKRVMASKADDADRAKQLRKLRLLQKRGDVSKKTTLQDGAVGKKRKRGEEDDSDEDDSEDVSDTEVDNDGSLARLLKAAKGELYFEDDDDDEASNEDEDEDDQRQAPQQKGSRYRSIASDSDDDSG